MVKSCNVKDKIDKKKNLSGKSESKLSFSSHKWKITLLGDHKWELSSTLNIAISNGRQQRPSPYYPPSENVSTALPLSSLHAYLWSFHRVHWNVMHKKAPNQRATRDHFLDYMLQLVVSSFSVLLFAAEPRWDGCFLVNFFVFFFKFLARWWDLCSMFVGDNTWSTCALSAWFFSLSVLWCWDMIGIWIWGQRICRTVSPLVLVPMILSLTAKFGNAFFLAKMSG